ncbi:hypothetical protein B0H17DRAFT_1199045 [Mycena rosella]|uniref:RRM domain-containing protein n=1 Tax=Mycena rosella TaxID=1033263 RepID=A0AAD7GMP1_MYCRO|nr:hypothetical protein B0H17DRAFT_1199045 [Mycena rosella]
MAASSSPSYGLPPHPYLHTSFLFIDHLPSHVSEEKIKQIFQDPQLRATLSFNRSKNRRKRAEKALATLHLRPIPNLEPPVILKFCTTANLKAFEAPDPAVFPRVIKTLPAGCSEATLYDALRPYGPLYSVRIDPIAGGLVQFWTEDNAQDAEICLVVAQPKMVLQAYDSCSLFCSNISFDLNAAALRTHFDEFGTIISTEIITNLQTGKSRGIGFVTFSLASEASAAMAAMHGAEIQWRSLSVTYRVLKKGSDAKPEPPRRGIPAETKRPTPSPKPTTPSLKPTRPPQTNNEPSTNENITQLNDKIKTLEGLYAAEVEERTAAQAENARLRDELESTKRGLEMAESRLKILQLEADRPLWERAKKKREEDEKAEVARDEQRRRAAELEESRRKMREFQAQDEERKRAAEEAEKAERLRREAEEKARQEKEEQERKAREKAERERKAKEAREKREREQRWKAATQAEEARCAMCDEERWSAGAWTPARALERLRLQMDEFDRIKFSEAQPLTFRVIPWPVLTDPLDLDVEQIDWDAVEMFFARAKAQMADNVAEYNSLVERVHRMFHPDKWKARGVLLTVMDEELKGVLETAGNVVAQAMTPLWRKSKGYS